MFFFEAPWLTKYLIAESCYKVCDEQPPQKKNVLAAVLRLKLLEKLIEGVDHVVRKSSEP